ncbi:hypothetical protein DXG03_006969 [Asterophora parasitica]|uniref:Uncharacterized protein n=1 Tax=Asterophora parasitica TaxID=117018 RepID=A0A9P7GIJ3_9AGAR|nr:hypothetical protein DXG03_006969 [Asterophora parasitica]
MASAGVWLDFDAIRHTVKSNTVDKLKQILTGFNDECGTHMSKTGKKQEVIDRIVGMLDYWRTNNVEDRWVKGRAIIVQVRSTGIYTPSRMAANPVVLPPPVTHNHMPNMLKSAAFAAALPGSSSIARYDPFAPGRKHTGPIASSSAPPKPTGVLFEFDSKTLPSFAPIKLHPPS